MRTKRFECAVAMVLAAGACGQGNSDNVMAAGANQLSPAQVDLALGPELMNVGNELDSANEMNAAAPVDTTGTEDAASTTARTPPRPAPDPKPEPQPEPEAETEPDEPADSPPNATNSAEE